jgi:hypothetical protein
MIKQSNFRIWQVKRYNLDMQVRGKLFVCDNIYGVVDYSGVL